MKFARSALAGLLLAASGACGPAARLPEPQRIPAPNPGEVERILFLVGDPGQAFSATAPLFPRLRRDIEEWAERLGADSAVTVLFLGDIVYPVGFHAPGTPEFPHDSAVVMSQVGVLGGPLARKHRAQGYFVAGNHDWGLQEDWNGFVRLAALDAFLEVARQATGASVRLAPEVGTGGPYVLDLGEHVRLLLLDTAWWLLDGGWDVETEHAAVLAGIEKAMESAGDREVLIAAHHPFKSAGPHGGEFSFWRTLGVRYLLARSGAILQDLTSLPYRELEKGLRAIFARTGPPMAFLAGHEHSLQIIRGVEPTDPDFSVVSGAASKTSSVAMKEGMTFGSSAPGYMRLVVENDGGLTLFVVAAPDEYRTCPPEEEARVECMARGVAAFETVHSQRLR